MSDTQTQSGRELDVAMARVMGWQVLKRWEMWDWQLYQASGSFPSMVLGKREDDYTVYHSGDDERGVDWRPSTNIAHAFEVQRDGWRWDFIEEDLRIRVYLTYRRSDNWQSVIAGGVLWEEMPDRASAYALARCRAALAWWQAQKQNRH